MQQVGMFLVARRAKASLLLRLMGAMYTRGTLAIRQLEIYKSIIRGLLILAITAVMCFCALRRGPWLLFTVAVGKIWALRLWIACRYMHQEKPVRFKK